ncbi:MAG: hypothetical protein FWH21_05860 [Kiritimatiellaeota bacterium]|nr:hypothetical protein [Kiritimatiellota bacterium]
MKKSPYHSLFHQILSLGILLLLTSCKTEVSHIFLCECVLPQLTDNEKRFIDKHREKLEHTVIPLIHMDDVTILEAIFWLSHEIKSGMSFIQQTHGGEPENTGGANNEDVFSDNTLLPTFSLHLRNINVLEALDYMCQRTGCVWQMSETGRIYVSDSKEILQRSDRRFD